jgi:NAD(P)H-hydrate epimerase
MKVLTAEQMQALDRLTIQDVGIPGIVLMENAGRSVASTIVERFGQNYKRAVVLAGKGNNGGDGYVVARLLADEGWDVEVFVFSKKSEIVGDALTNLNVLDRYGYKISFISEPGKCSNLLEVRSEEAILIDALFGTGLKKPVLRLYAKVIEWLNSQASPVVSVDIPSGIDASSGKVLGAAVKADLTVTFAMPKVGLVTYPGAAYVGELVTSPIGIPQRVLSQAKADYFWMDFRSAQEMLPRRQKDGHKGTFGHLLVIAGSLGKSGAAVMTSESGLRGGAGLVTLACPKVIQPIVASQLKEVMTLPISDLNGESNLLALEDVQRAITDKQALAIGPGLGSGREVFGLVRRLVQDTNLPMVIDADGLNALCGHTKILQRKTDQAIIITPHPGEMSRLLEVTPEKVQSDRIAVAKTFASKFNVVVVLKGARTLIASPDGQTFINSTGHAGMASGGMGDVLTGLIGSLLAQGFSAKEAATLGAYLHGLAADRLFGKFGDAGLIATDLMAEIPAARKALIYGGSDADCS